MANACCFRQHSAPVMEVPPTAIRFIHSIEERYIKHLPKTRIADISVIDGDRKFFLAAMKN